MFSYKVNIRLCEESSEDFSEYSLSRVLTLLGMVHLIMIVNENSSIQMARHMGHDQYIYLYEVQEIL